MNKEFQTPMFKLINGVSSCPYEQGTLDRYKPFIKIDPPVLFFLDFKFLNFDGFIFILIFIFYSF